jgi:hypothetical protein
MKTSYTIEEVKLLMEKAWNDERRDGNYYGGAIPVFRVPCNKYEYARSVFIERTLRNFD